MAAPHLFVKVGIRAADFERLLKESEPLSPDTRTPHSRENRARACLDLPKPWA